MSHVTAAYFFRLVVRAGDVPPLFNDSAQVDAVEWNVHLTDLIVLWEAVEVVDGKDERLGADLGVRYLNTANR